MLVRGGFFLNDGGLRVYKKLSHNDIFDTIVALQQQRSTLNLTKTPLFFSEERAWHALFYFFFTF